MTLRLFIALELGEEEKKALERIQSRLKHKLPYVRWVRAAAIHLTLRFLGDTDEREIQRIEAAISAAAAGERAFNIILRGVGAFPDGRRPRVIWIGVDEPTGGLMRIAVALNQKLAAAGFPAEDRPFSPHITIGRVREHGGRGDCAALLSGLRDEKAGLTHVREICLLRSELTPSGPVHTVMCRVPLED